MEYTVLRRNRRTLSVTVREGKVIVFAPLGLSDRKIEEFVRRHTIWISRRVEEQKGAFVPDLSDGAQICIAGRPRTVATGRARLTEDMLFLPAEGRERAMISLLKRFTRERMGAITEEVARRSSLRYEKISVSSARTRWGSCNARGNISYTFRTAFLPDGLALYLAVHELCHTRHMDHGKEFWVLVEKMLPDWRERRKALKKYIWAMKCL